jgi:hypothetical protein
MAHKIQYDDDDDDNDDSSAAYHYLPMLLAGWPRRNATAVLRVSR